MSERANDAPRLRWENTHDWQDGLAGEIIVATLARDKLRNWRLKMPFVHGGGTYHTDSAAKAAAESAWAEWLDMAGLQPSEGRAHG